MAKTHGDKIDELLRLTAALETQMKALERDIQATKESSLRIAVLEDRSEAYKEQMSKLEQELVLIKGTVAELQVGQTRLNEQFKFPQEERQSQTWRFWTVVGPVLGGVLGGVVTVLLAKLLT